MANEEAKKVKPSDYWLTIGGKKRQVKFGNRALLEVEEKYGNLSEATFTALGKDLQEKPMKMIPWLVNICIKDKEGLEADDEKEQAYKIIDAMDDDGLTVKEVMDVVSSAMNDSLSHMVGDGKKKRTVKN